MPISTRAVRIALAPIRERPCKLVDVSATKGRSSQKIEAVKLCTCAVVIVAVREEVEERHA